MNTAWKGCGWYTVKKKGCGWYTVRKKVCGWYTVRKKGCGWYSQKKKDVVDTQSGVVDTVRKKKGCGWYTVRKRGDGVYVVWSHTMEYWNSEGTLEERGETWLYRVCIHTHTWTYRGVPVHVVPPQSVSTVNVMAKPWESKVHFR